MPVPEPVHQRRAVASLALAGVMAASFAIPVAADDHVVRFATFNASLNRGAAERIEEAA